LIRKNPKCIAKMKELGVSADKLQEALSLPVDQIPGELLSLVGLVVICQVVLASVQDQIRSLFEPYFAQVGCIAVGFPGMITTTLLSSAFFTIKYEVELHVMIVSALTLPLYGFLYLQWVKLFTIPQCLLIGYLIIFAIVTWAQNGATVVSVLCWIAGLFFLIVFLVMCYLWFRIMLPILEIELEILLEHMAIEVYSACQCERDPEVMQDLQREAAHRLRFCPAFIREHLSLAGLVMLPLMPPALG